MKVWLVGIETKYVLFFLMDMSSTIQSGNTTCLYSFMDFSRVLHLFYGMKTSITRDMRRLYKGKEVKNGQFLGWTSKWKCSYVLCKKKKYIKNQIIEFKVAKTAVFWHDGLVCIYELKNNGIELFTVVCLVTWSLNKSDAGGHCLLRKFLLINIRAASLT